MTANTESLMAQDRYIRSEAFRNTLAKAIHLHALTWESVPMSPKDRQFTSSAYAESLARIVQAGFVDTEDESDEEANLGRVAGPEIPHAVDYRLKREGFDYPTSVEVFKAGGKVRPSKECDPVPPIQTASQRLAASDQEFGGRSGLPIPVDPEKGAATGAEAPSPVVPLAQGTLHATPTAKTGAPCPRTAPSGPCGWWNDRVRGDGYQFECWKGVVRQRDLAQ
jgi:hypothetical protein